MNKKTEKKILDAIKNRVLEKEKQLDSQKDIHELREATKEALAEMTSLEKSEVDEIAQVVRQEFERKQKKRRTLTIVLVAIIAIVAIVVFSSRVRESNRFSMEEEFNSNQLGWDLYKDYNYNRYFKDGYYVFQNGTDDWYYWDYVDFSPPEKYTIDLQSIWKKGKYDSYGLILYMDDDNYCVFNLNPEGKARFIKKINDKWVGNELWKLDKAKKGDGTAKNKQHIEVDNNNFKYYVNNNLISEGNISDLYISKIGVRTGGPQTIHFDDLLVKNSATDEVILHENFDVNNKGWSEGKKFKKKSEFLDGAYVFTGNTKDYCYWTSVPLQIEGDYDFILRSRWVKGELGNYGLMFLEDNENYFAFEFRNDGSARYICNIKGGEEYETIEDYVNTGFESDGEISYEQKVELRGNQFTYYVDNKMIYESSLSRIKFTKIGLRICGRQTVAFDHLSIIPK